MIEIEFSVMEDAAGDANSLLPLLDVFEKQYHIRVKLTGITWYAGWTDIAKFGIFGHGPDVSCIGTSWIGSRASMHALRPFNPQQIHALGGDDAFFESSCRPNPHASPPALIRWNYPPGATRSTCHPPKTMSSTAPTCKHCKPAGVFPPFACGARLKTNSSLKQPASGQSCLPTPTRTWMNACTGTLTRWPNG